MKEILGIVVVFILISSFVFGFCYLVDKTECSIKARALGYSCSYGFFQGCVLIKPDGKRILLEQLREFN